MSDWNIESRMIHEGTLRSQFGETSEALFLTQGYVYDNMEQAEARFKGEVEGFLYSRYGNPTVDMFEKRFAALEGAECAHATASGMAAVAAALMGICKAGDHLISSRVLFGSCGYIVSDLLPRFGVETTLIDGTNLDEWRAAIRPNTKGFFLETPGNPTTEIIDIAAVAEIAHAAGAKLVVDSALATPVLQKPIALGADCVIYSATKHVDGQGRCLGGIVLASKEFIDAHVRQLIRHTGASLSPFNAWVLLKGLETLHIRVERQNATATTIAKMLAEHPRVTRIYYPGHPSHPQYAIAQKQMTGGGTVLAFEIEGGKQASFKLGNALKLIKISNNFGDAKSIITHPATTTHHRYTAEARAQMGVSDGLLRFSAGLEHVGDLMADLEQGLKAAQL